MSVDEKVISKVAKLLAKAERASTDEEAEAFAAKAQELVAKHSIDLLTLAARTGHLPTDIIVTKMFDLSKSYAQEDYWLWNAVGEANDCRAAWDRYAKTVVMVGYADDIINVEMLATSLLVQRTRATNRAAKTHLNSWWSAHDKFVWRRSFATAFAAEVGKRLMATRAEAVVDAGGDDLLPILKAKADRVDEYTEDLGWEEGRRSRRRASLGGAAAGSQAGQAADVGAARVGTGSFGQIGGGS